MAHRQTETAYRMSALGQKQTCEALKADVRFVPIADIIRLWDDTHSAGGLRECAELSEKKVQSIGGLLVDVAVLYDRLVFLGDIKSAIQLLLQCPTSLKVAIPNFSGASRERVDFEDFDGRCRKCRAHP